MAFLVVGLGVVLFVAAVLARGRARQARVTRETDAWVRFLRDDLTKLVEVRV